MIRLLIVDDQRLMRDGLKTILQAETDMDVVAVASDGEEAVDVIRAGTVDVDVILMDIRMPKMNGIEATAQLKQLRPDVRVLMLTTFDEQEDVVGALQAGAVGYLVKDMAAHEIAAAIRTARGGGAVLPPGIASKYLAAMQQQIGAVQRVQPDEAIEGSAVKNNPETSGVTDRTRPEFGLTEREVDVLRCLALGMSNREIAEHLFVTEGTVKNHVSSLISKLDLRDRTQAALYAVRHGF